MQRYYTIQSRDFKTKKKHRIDKATLATLQQKQKQAQIKTTMLFCFYFSDNAHADHNCPNKEIEISPPKAEYIKMIKTFEYKKLKYLSLICLPKCYYAITNTSITDLPRKITIYPNPKNRSLSQIIKPSLHN